MKAFILFFAIAFFAISNLNAQTRSSEIQSEKVFAGYKFTRNARQLNINQLAAILESNPEASQALRPARTTSTIAAVVGVAGGALVGWQLGALVGGGEANWLAGGIGAGLIVATIPLTAKFNRQAKNAVDIYNAGLRGSMNMPYKPELLLGSTSNGLGLVLNF